MSELPLQGRVAVVTGAGRGLGRAHALTLARYGAKLLVNDYGSSLDGAAALGIDGGQSASVVSEIEAMGGEAIADAGDVGSWEDADVMIAKAVERFGTVDILVNNAGILRPKTLVGMAKDDVAALIHVHLTGTFAMTHFAALHWRQRFKEHGVGGGRLINTTSAAGLYGFAQANYAAAKAGVATLTAIAALELGAYGVTANAVAPIALTRMGPGIAPSSFTPEHVSELVAWLAGEAAQDVTGHVFNAGGGHISIADRWHAGAGIDHIAMWTFDELAIAVPDLVARAAPHPDTMGYYPDEPRSPLLPVIEMPRGNRS